MGSCRWLGVQVFFHGAMELTGKVTSAAWLEPGSGGAGRRNLLVDSWQVLFLLPAEPPALQVQGGVLTRKIKTHLQKVRDFFSHPTDLIKTLFQHWLQMEVDFTNNSHAADFCCSSVPVARFLQASSIFCGLCQAECAPLWAPGWAEPSH